MHKCDLMEHNTGTTEPLGMIDGVLERELSPQPGRVYLNSKAFV